jgi:hypothetical protein
VIWIPAPDVSFFMITKKWTFFQSILVSLEPGSPTTL